MFYDVLSYQKLFQNLIIPGYLDGLDHDFQIPTCIIVYLPPSKIIPWKLFKKKLFHNLVDTLE